MFAFKFEVRMKKCPCKNKTVQQTKVISINQSFKVLSTDTNTCRQPWPPLISGLVDDALLELSQKQLYFKFLQGSVATLFRWNCKILSYFVANLSKTLHIYFYHNRSSIVEVMTKIFGVFMPHSVLPNALCLLANANLYQARLLKSTS